MSADLLRKAAAKLRDAAEHATDGPWYVVGPPWNDQTPYVVAGHPDPDVGIFLADPEHPTMSRRGTEGADAAWIALASPALAEPLAGWLEEEALQWDLPPCDDPTGVCNRCEWRPAVNDALAVARAILGEVADGR